MMHEIFMALSRLRHKKYCSNMHRIILVFTDESHISFGIPRGNGKTISELKLQQLFGMTRTGLIWLRKGRVGERF